MAFAHDIGMITQQLDLCILTAPLAAIDRRALSQAWYSALHLAKEGPSATTRPPQAEPSVTSVYAPRPRHDGCATTRNMEAATTPLCARRKSPTAAEPLERRAARSTLARRIERAFLDPARKLARATFALEGTKARVHVALQTNETGMRLVAVCPTTLRAGVARALDQARYALAVRGITLTVALNGDAGS
jgi:hypothetical protein